MGYKIFDYVCNNPECPSNVPIENTDIPKGFEKWYSFGETAEEEIPCPVCQNFIDGDFILEAPNDYVPGVAHRVFRKCAFDVTSSDKERTRERLMRRSREDSIKNSERYMEDRLNTPAHKNSPFNPKVQEDLFRKKGKI